MVIPEPLAFVRSPTGQVLFEADAAASSSGYRAILQLAEQHAPGRRAFAVEGSGSYGKGLARFLIKQGEQVIEVVGGRSVEVGFEHQDRIEAAGCEHDQTGKMQALNRSERVVRRGCHTAAQVVQPLRERFQLAGDDGIDEVENR